MDQNVAASLLVALQQEKYEAFCAVASTLGVNPTGLNFWNIGAYLKRTNVSHLAIIGDGGRLRDAFKLASIHSDFARDFLQLVDASRDEKVIKRASGGEDRFFPTFSVAGTVTGRILVSDPYLQQLRKKYREIVAPDIGKRAIYLDYAQFEPGIMAFLSEDEELRRCYGKGDLYSDLCLRVFGSNDHRSTAKRMFLAFCYGMAPDGIARIVCKADDAETASAHQRAVEEFFSAFPGLKRYREESERLLEKRGYTASLFGNRRWRTSSGALTFKERRWAVNQPIQATAALIFKEAIIDLAADFGSDSILLPVHDAVLMQFDDDADFELKRSRAEELMLRAFRRRCTGVEPRVTSGPFTA